jgi:hypothetical protein
MKYLNKIMGIVLILLAGCQSGNKNLIYQSDKFSVYTDSVVQGEFTAKALSANEISSNYRSPSDGKVNSTIQFKFSINSRDNEMQPGHDHFVWLRPQNGVYESKLIKFGEQILDSVGQKHDLLPFDTRWKILLDMRHVLKAFEEKGFFTTYNGEKIYKADFKGVYIAGNTLPLIWDFDNLRSHKDLELTDADNDGIFEIELLLNPKPDASKPQVWKLSADISKYPQYSSNLLLADALYNLSLEEMVKDIRPDRCFMAGEKWDGVWTRDISYSIVLSLAMLEPEIAKNSLMRKVKNRRIIQDTGTGGSWPISTDRQTWALAAWEVYLSTGDQKWLEESYEIISNSMEDDLKTAVNAETGLFFGESSFLDWRKQTYPIWMEPVDIFLSQNLGTNAVFYKTLTILAKMGDLLQKKTEYAQKAEALKQAINQQLWNEKANYYGQYVYGRYHQSLSPRAEALGEALCLLTGIADADRAAKVLANTPVMEFGIPTIYPQIPGIPPYHNESVWPFVQAYWTWAGAKAKNTSIVEHGIATMYRQAALFLTNKENMVLETGDHKGTEINSSRQLWSVAGNLAMVYRVLFGMDLQADKLVFAPFVPKVYDGIRHIKNFKYRNAIFDIQLIGYGDGIEKFELDGKQTDNFVSANLTGKHQIVITLNNKMDSAGMTKVQNSVSPDYPDVKQDGQTLSWTAVKSDVNYRIYQNAKLLKEQKETTFKLTGFGQWQVSAVNQVGVESFLSKPVFSFDEKKTMQIEAEQFGKAGTIKSTGFTGKGFVELSLADKKAFEFSVNAPQEGEYLIEFRYANGSGPINTDNKCGIRSLYNAGIFAGSLVFSQRGTDEWSNWGTSNPLKIKLNQGDNKLELRFEPWNNNMNVDVNTFLIDHIKVMPLK